MKYFLTIILVVTFILGFNESRANSLFDSLNLAYLNNHKLNAERADMRASKEEKRESVSEFLPSVTISGYISEQDNTGGSVSNFKPSEQSLEIEQKIFQGFSGVSNLKMKMYGQNIAEFKLKKTEQETLLDAAKREANNVRKNVGICDVTSLGKIDIKGPDTAELLNRVYTNAWLKLPVGKARYGAMLREDGIVMDDGTTTRISENHYHMTTTTAQAANVLSHLEYYLQVVWPELKVNVVSSTEQWAGAAIAGPKSRNVLQKLFPDIDVSNEGLPFMGYVEGNLFGVHARIFRISFSGELAYEVNVESDNGNFMWEKINEVGKEFAIQPYGTEALSTLRIEMGHVAGSELDGRTSPYDNGLQGLVSKKKDFIGKRSLGREAFIAEDRQKVVGVVPIDKKTSIPEGSHLVKDADAKLPNPKLGHISASCWSVEYNNPFSLAILHDGKNMIGQKLFALSPLRNKSIPVEIVSSHYVDPKGERVRS